MTLDSLIAELIELRDVYGYGTALVIVGGSSVVDLAVHPDDNRVRLDTGHAPLEPGWLR